ncbi:MAG: glycoside hydrolase 43 family protein [Bacteroidetes bacterium]|nr:glycoside hydrolase 43 family protein [Bacteroidota bacterium]
MAKYFYIFLIIACSIGGQTRDEANNNLFTSDNFDGTYSNPIIHADYSDPDVIRVEDDFYLVSSSFSQFPGLPVLHSKDLVNWKIISHAVKEYPFDEFKKPQHGNGIWAPSIRYHEGYYWIFFGDPDHGILMTKAKNPAGPWTPLHLVAKANGWIDPCPLWDDDGQAYLIHAWAKSRSGINAILTLHRMSSDGTKLLDDGLPVFDGKNIHPTIEGPKLYRKNDFYYIFAPAGGVKTGWQTVLRSKNIYGPYESRVVLEQGSTNINGPHQGAMVELKSGESWFVHFQDKFAYGRIVHLNPVSWKDNWPIIGIDFDQNGIGEPVQVYNKPDVTKIEKIALLQTSDEFDKSTLGLQWQWEALGNSKWISLNDKKGSLRLYCIQNSSKLLSLKDLPNIIGQKFPANEFSVEVKMTVNLKDSSDSGGLVILGSDYSAMEVSNSGSGLKLIKKTFHEKNKKEVIEEIIPLTKNDIFLKIYIKNGAICSFAYSYEGKSYHLIGKEFFAQPGRWVGAKIGLYAISGKAKSKSYVDVDYIRFSK